MGASPFHLTLGPVTHRDTGGHPTPAPPPMSSLESGTHCYSLRVAAGPASPGGAGELVKKQQTQGPWPRWRMGHWPADRLLLQKQHPEWWGEADQALASQGGLPQERRPEPSCPSAPGVILREAKVGWMPRCLCAQKAPWWLCPRATCFLQWRKPRLWRGVCFIIDDGIRERLWKVGAERGRELGSFQVGAVAEGLQQDGQLPCLEDTGGGRPCSTCSLPSLPA